MKRPSFSGCLPFFFASGWNNLEHNIFQKSLLIRKVKIREAIIVCVWKYVVKYQRIFTISPFRFSFSFD